MSLIYVSRRGLILDTELTPLLEKRGVSQDLNCLAAF
jgi:hypothetical protein